MTTNVFNHGVVHVQARMCDTCIFRPGNLMELRDGCVEQMVADCHAEGGVIPCHKTIHGLHKQEAVCRGFFDRHSTPGLQVAQRLGVIKEVDLR